MSIERDPHGWFAGTWLAWFACVLYAIAQPQHPALGLTVLLAFLPIEGLAVYLDTGMRDTLSETFTWLQRHLSKHRHIARGWNAMLLLVILSIAYLLGRTVWHYSGSYAMTGAFFVLSTVWLYDHLFHPEVHG